jgi:hypothetical protein
LKPGWDRRNVRLFAIAIAALLPLILPGAAQASSSSGSAAGGTTCCLIVVGIIAVINIALLIWLMKDAEARGTSAGAWLLVVLIFGVFGWLAYLIARPKGKLVPCPECGRQKPIVDPICPHCGRRVV